MSLLKSKPKSDGFEYLKTELNKGNNLIDYFLILGVKPSICTNEFLYDNDINDFNSKYNSYLTPEILSKFPPFDKTIVNIDEGILNYAFPNKFQVTEYKLKPQPEFFSFILDNNFFSINHPHKYITCLLFYESLLSYNQLKSKITEDFDTNTTQSETVEYTRSYSGNTTYSRSSHDSPRSTISVSKKKYKNYYIPKCICVISTQPFFTAQGKILKAVYNYSKINKLTIPIEKIIQNLIIEIPMPPKGIYGVEYQLLNEKVYITQIKENELPKYNHEIGMIMSIFPHDIIIEVIRYLLYEIKMIFFSSNIKQLCPIIYGFVSMIYPFKFPFQIATNVPLESYDIIESISPYIFGINKEYKEDFFQEHSIRIENESILIVDIDNKTISLHSNEQYPSLPLHYTQKLKEQLNIKKQEITKGIRENLIDSVNCKCEQTTELLFQFFVSILQTYPDYLNNDYYTSHEEGHTTGISTLFKVKEFIASFPVNDRPFYTKLVKETQMFSDFIYKRMIPKDTNDKLEILFFDEKILEKTNRNRFSKSKQLMFINSNEYEIRNKYSVPKARELSEEDKEYYYDTETRMDLLNYGQNIKLGLNNEIMFTYTVFPMLSNTILFREEKEYYIPPILSEGLQNINTDLVAKSHLSSIAVKNSEMENYIYLSWLQLWACSFWYHNINERQYRFDQMIEILDKVIHHEMEIINLLFEALNKQNEEEMIMNLYNKIIQYRLNPSAYIYSIISKLQERNPITYKNSLKRESMHMEKEFRQRTIKMKYEGNVIGKDIRLYAYDSCIECQESINLLKISQDFQQMQKDIVWAKCPNCSNYILPKLNIRIGNELNKNDLLTKQTSTIDGVVLYSPYSLKLNIIEGIFKDSNRKLDVDNFRYQFSALFWDSIWYFQLMNIDFILFLPYTHNDINKTISSITNKQMIAVYFNKKLADEYSLIQENKKEKKPKRREYKNLKIENEIEYSVEYVIEEDTVELLYSKEIEKDKERSEGSYICGDPFVENSLCSETLSKLDSDSDAEIQRGRSKIIKSTILNEIEEDADENILSKFNTPITKLIHRSFSKKESEKGINFGASNNKCDDFMLDKESTTQHQANPNLVNIDEENHDINDSPMMKSIRHLDDCPNNSEFNADFQSMTFQGNLQTKTNNQSSLEFTRHYSADNPHLTTSNKNDKNFSSLFSLDMKNSLFDSKGISPSSTSNIIEDIKGSLIFPDTPIYSKENHTKMIINKIDIDNKKTPEINKLPEIIDFEKERYLFTEAKKHVTFFDEPLYNDKTKKVNRTYKRGATTKASNIKSKLFEINLFELGDLNLIDNYNTPRNKKILSYKFSREKSPSKI